MKSVRIIDDNEQTRQGPTGVKKFLVEQTDSSDVTVASTRSPALWKSDLLILIIEHLQLYALILSLSLRWPWPTDYIRGSRFMFVINFDLWELVKTDDDIYRGVAAATIDPNEVPFDYFAFALSWLLVVTCLPIVCVVCHYAMKKIKEMPLPTMIRWQSHVLHVFLILAQLLCLPFAIVTVRLLQCDTYTPPGADSRYKSVVLSDTDCWSGTHIGLLLPMSLVSIFYLIVIPLWMMKTIKRQLVVSSLCCLCRGHRTHENYLRLKEMEYSLELEDGWLNKHCRLFSSYRRSWVLYRPVGFFVKVLVVLIYGVLFYSDYYQANSLFAVLLLWLLLLLFLPVYRLHVFNVLLIISLLANTSNAVLGLLVVLETESSLVIGQNLVNALLVIQFGWLTVTILCTLYLLLRHYHKIGPLVVTTTAKNTSLWPTLRSSTNDHKYLLAILQSRRVLNYTHSIPSILSPTHQLANQIQVINAYCREAELLNDPLHSTLWATLDELIDVHNAVRPLSIFANSTKLNVQKTANELIQLLPSLRCRLEQREHDLILVPPIKRRLLLKMFILSTFIYHKQAKISALLSEYTIPHHLGASQSDVWQESERWDRRQSEALTLASSRPSTQGDPKCEELIEQVDRQFPLVTVT
ncbi:uncharacterized protein [Dysidea avara]|uniref:uncharacterized protein n=1 Tax=Dysidea avara TaxID=196820 RepID=UPI0033286823